MVKERIFQEVSLPEYSSRIPGFREFSISERQRVLAESCGLAKKDLMALREGGLDEETLSRLIENPVGKYDLPFGIATNFRINDRDMLIPMVIEEPSVIAGASKAAKMICGGGRLEAHASEPLMIGQVQLLFGDSQSFTIAREQLIARREELIETANQGIPHLISRGGGVRDIEIREFSETKVGPMVVVHLLVDTRDAMGANLINTACETVTSKIIEITEARVNLRILSNLSDRRIASASAKIPFEILGVSEMELSGEEVAKRIVEAQTLAEVDPYRAATHNKGIFNGIDAIAIATGNDWRAIEAGAHAWATRSGQYQPLTTWEQKEGFLYGEIKLPLAVGTVGRMIKTHPITRISLKILGVSSSQELASVMAAVGLTQNFAALHALTTDGIQRGHMELHERKKG